MSVTVKLLLRESKKRSDGKAPVYLRITANRKSRFKSTGIYIRPRHWNERRGKVRKSHELAAALNDKLRSIRLNAERAALEADTARAVKAQLDGRTGSLTSFFKTFIEGLKRRDQYWERKKYRPLAPSLEKAARLRRGLHRPGQLQRHRGGTPGRLRRLGQHLELDWLREPEKT